MSSKLALTLFQDSPAVKATVKAIATVPKNVKCVFSGLTIDSYPNKINPNLTDYKFEQKMKEKEAKRLQDLANGIVKTKKIAGFFFSYFINLIHTFQGNFCIFLNMFFCF